MELLRLHIGLKLLPFLIGILIFFFLTLSGMVEFIFSRGGELVSFFSVPPDESAAAAASGYSDFTDEPEVLKSSLKGWFSLSNFSDQAAVQAIKPQSNQKLAQSPIFRINVEKGWKISSIAQEYGVSLKSLASLNRFERAADLGLGGSVLVPRIDGFRVRWNVKGGTKEIARHYGTLASRVWPLDEKEYFVSGAMDNVPADFIEDAFFFPVYGNVIRNFGEGFDYITGIPYNSEGINIAAEAGMPVKAARGGRVIRTGQHDSYGLYVMLRHRDDWVSFYGHLKRVDVAPGDSLEGLESLGLAGESGVARNVQVHFALIYGNKAVDPLKYLN